MTTYYVAVDPGIRGCGAALFADQVLLRAAYVPNPCTSGNGPRESASAALAVQQWLELYGYTAEVLALEYPRVYPARSQKGDQNDLLPLAGVVCALAACYPSARVIRYFPREWKGTVDADVMLTRIESKLTPVERTRLAPCPGDLRHNMIDAVGIGMRAVGRLSPGPLIHRGGGT